MSRSLAPVLLTSIACACGSHGPIPSAPTPASVRYHDLLAKVQSRDTSIDFTSLRLAYAASSEYAPYGSGADAHRDSMLAAFRRQDFRRAILEADAALTIDYLDIRTHLLRGAASERLGDTAAAGWDRAIAGRLVRSIMLSGSGTVDSPYVVISVAEEYGVLEVTGYVRGVQGLGRCGKRPCDILEATHRETHQQRTFHFDITLPMAHMNRLLREK